MAKARDYFVDLMARELASLAGLGTLGHFDLQFVRIDQVVRGDAKSRRGYLLDGAAAQVTLESGLKRSSSSPPSPYSICPRCGSWQSPAFHVPSLLIDPNDMAPVVKRLTISFAGSTS